ncbi:MAG: hypothetical protein ACT4PZ_23730 [Panacagrimonas sp.]
MSIKQSVAACLSVSLLAGCSGIGDGNEPEALRVLPVSQLGGLTTRDELDALFEQPQEPLETFTCLRDGAAAVVRFSDGDVAIFSNRVVWSSSDETVVEVDNFDDEPDDDSNGLLFAAGSLKPVGPGSAMVTADFLGLTSSIEVKVTALDPSTIVVNPAKTFLVPRSRQVFEVQAMVDGVLRSVSSSATFRFETPQCSDGVDNDDDDLIDFPDDRNCTSPADSVESALTQCNDGLDNDGDGSIDDDDEGCDLGERVDENPVAIIDASRDQLGNAVVTAVAASDDPLQLQVLFNAPCGVSPTVPVRVADLESLSLDYEEGAGFGDGRLIVGSTQFLRVTGNFGDLDGDGTDETQDLSAQAALTSTTPAIVGTGGLFDNLNRVTGGANSTMPPAAVGNVTVTANFGRTADPDGETGPLMGEPGVTSDPPLPFNVVNVVVDALAIGPADPTTGEPVTIAPRERTNFKAFGTYTFPNPGGVPRQMDLTRHVTWRVTAVDGVPVKPDDEPTAVIVTGINADAGLAVSLVLEDAADQNSVVTIAATLVRGVVDSTVPLPADDLVDLVKTTTLNIEVPSPAP